jgi:hypothetical protein
VPSQSSRLHLSEHELFEELQQALPGKDRMSRFGLDSAKASLSRAWNGQAKGTQPLEIGI